MNLTRWQRVQGQLDQIERAIDNDDLDQAQKSVRQMRGTLHIPPHRQQR